MFILHDEDTKKAIYNAFESGMKGVDIAKMTKLSEQQISDVKKAWRAEKESPKELKQDAIVSVQIKALAKDVDEIKQKIEKLCLIGNELLNIWKEG